MNAVCETAPTSTQAVRVEPQRAPAGALTDDQAEAVAALRRMIELTFAPNERADSMVWSDAARVEAEAHMDDFTLLRFVIARSASLEAALVMFSTAMHWRTAKSINSLFVELHPLAPSSARHDAARAHSVSGCGGVDRTGVPYFVMRAGRADLAGFHRQPRLLELMTDAAAVSGSSTF